MSSTNFYKYNRESQFIYSVLEGLKWGYEYDSLQNVLATLELKASLYHA